MDIDLDIERLSGKSGTATYAEIRAYVEKKHGLNVSTLYIAQIKDKSDWRNARTIGRVPEKEKHLFARPRKKRR